MKDVSLDGINYIGLVAQRPSGVAGISFSIQA